MESTSKSFDAVRQLIVFGSDTVPVLLFTTDCGHILWFKAVAMALLLEYNDPNKGVQNNVKNESRLSLRNVLSKYGHPVNLQQEYSNNELNTVYIDKSGVFQLITACRKPKAAVFKAWLFDEVLPTIHETGTYTLRPGQQLSLPGPVPTQPILQRVSDTDTQWLPEQRASLGISQFQKGIGTVYLMLVVIHGSNKLWIKYGNTDDISERFKTHNKSFREMFPFFAKASRDFQTVERAFGIDVLSMGFREDLCVTIAEKRYQEVFEYSPDVPLSTLVRMMDICIDRAEQTWTPKTDPLEELRLTIKAKEMDLQLEEFRARQADSKAREAEMQLRIEELKLNRCSSFAAGMTLTDTNVSAPIKTTSAPLQVDTKPLEEEKVQADEADEAQDDHEIDLSEQPGDLPEDSRGYTAAELEDLAVEENKRRRGRPSKEKKQYGSSLRAQRTRALTELEIKDLKSFVRNECQFGTDQPLDKWVKTEQYCIMRMTLYDAYKQSCDKPVIYVKFKDFILGNYKVFEANRLIHNKRKVTPSGAVTFSHGDTHFVGIRLRRMPVTELSKEVSQFVKIHLEPAGNSSTTISVMFKEFDRFFPDWSCFTFNQEMLRQGHRLGKHPEKGEKAWLGMELRS